MFSKQCLPATNCAEFNSEVGEFTLFDLEAELICRREAPGQWCAYLTHMRGNNLPFLLGRVIN